MMDLGGEIVIKKKNAYMYLKEAVMEKKYHKGYELMLDSYENIEILIDSNMNQYGGEGNSEYRILIEENIKYVENDRSNVISNTFRRSLSIDMKPYSAVYFLVK